MKKEFQLHWLIDDVAPRSRMDVFTDGEIDNIVSNSKLVAKYNQVIDSDSAYEMLTAKLQEAAANPPARCKQLKKQLNQKKVHLKKLPIIQL